MVTYPSCAANIAERVATLACNVVTGIGQLNNRTTASALLVSLLSHHLSELDLVLINLALVILDAIVDQGLAIDTCHISAVCCPTNGV